MTDNSAANIKAGKFVDPLKDWPNDDLMVRKETRAIWRQNRPTAFRVLDWPELRQEFELHDAPASRGKRASRIQGLLSVALAGLGIIVLAVTTVLPAEALHAVTLAALLLMFLGGGLAIAHRLLLSSRDVWLGHRYWAERLRQLHFQSLLVHFDLVCAAITDRKHLAELHRLRGVWLDDFKSEARDPRAQIKEICEDRAATRTWLRPDWHEARSFRAEGPNAEALFEALGKQRIGIQYHYAKLNLGDDIYSPSVRTRLLKGVASAMTGLVVGIALIGIVTLAIGHPVLGIGLSGWTMLVGVASAIGLTSRATNDGLQAEADDERCQWYFEAVGNIKERFESADSVGRLVALRQLEEVAYRDLRLFLRAHKAANFET